MSKKPQTGVYIKAFALRIEHALRDIEFIGNDGKPYERDYEADARWYVAYHIASDMRTDYTTKDWAHFVLDGMQPLTDEDVKEFFYPEEDDEPINCMPTEPELIAWFHG